MMVMVRILIFILLITVAYVAFKVLRGIVFSMKSKRGPGTRGVEGGEMIQDPACGIYIPKTKAIEGRVKGETHFFCYDYGFRHLENNKYLVMRSLTSFRKRRELKRGKEGVKVNDAPGSSGNQP